MSTKSPGKYTKKYIKQDTARKGKRKVHKELFPGLKKKRKIVPANQDIETSEEFLKALAKSKKDVVRIEQITRGQLSNPLWNKYRHNLLTASNFGSVFFWIRSHKMGTESRSCCYRTI